MPAGAVSPASRALGFAGLLPQLGAALLTRLGPNADVGGIVAFIYGGLILSFLGGIWWGFAVRRTAGQGALALTAVLPSLFAFGLALMAGRGLLTLGWALALLGSAVMLTLVVDRHLATTGEASAGWMGLRVPLSLGLGALTILAGVLSS